MLYNTVAGVCLLVASLLPFVIANPAEHLECICPPVWLPRFTLQGALALSVSRADRHVVPLDTPAPVL